MRYAQIEPVVSNTRQNASGVNVSTASPLLPAKMPVATRLEVQERTCRVQASQVGPSIAQGRVR